MNGPCMVEGSASLEGDRDIFFPLFLCFFFFFFFENLVGCISADTTRMCHYTKRFFLSRFSFFENLVLV